MPKAEVGTPKWLANKMKAKGLQRLRWWCEMCQKQCRDENGFKCHRMSEQHQRQMKLFASTPDRYMDSFSKDFEHTFMRLMQTTYCRTRVLANTVYCDLISDKTHTHMNSTVWVTLSEFVQYLGRTGKCKIDRTERGWWLEYIDKDRLEKDKAAERLKRAELNEEQRNTRFIQAAIEKGKREQEKKDSLKPASAVHPEDPTTAAEAANVSFKMANIPTHGKDPDVPVKCPAPLPFGDTGGDDVVPTTKARPKSVIDKLMEERSKRRKTESDGCTAATEVVPPAAHPNPLCTTFNDPPMPTCSAQEAQSVDEEEEEEDAPWLAKGIVVRVVDNDLPKDYFNQKGHITNVTADGFVATVKLLTVQKTIKIDQANIDPVLPAPGGAVVFIRGPPAMVGGHSVVRDIDAANDTLVVDHPEHSKKRIRVQFGDVCKLHIPS